MVLLFGQPVVHQISAGWRNRLTLWDTLGMTLAEKLSRQEAQEQGEEFPGSRSSMRSLDLVLSPQVAGGSQKYDERRVRIGEIWGVLGSSVPNDKLRRMIAADFYAQWSIHQPTMSLRK